MVTRAWGLGQWGRTAPPSEGWTVLSGEAWATLPPPPQKPEHRWADPPLWGRGSCEHLFSAISFQKEVSGKPSSSPTFCKPCNFENVSPWLFYSAQK